MSGAGCLGLYPAILSQFSLKMCAKAKNLPKTPACSVQGCSRSSILIKLKSPWSVLVMIMTCLYLCATVFIPDEPMMAK